MPAATDHTGPFQSNISRTLLAVAVTIALALSSLTASSASGQEKKRPESKVEQDDTVRLHSDLVVLSVTVTDSSGGYAHGLKGKDFSILEDGKAQSLDSFSAEEAPFAAAILVDMSGSMQTKFGLVRGAAAAFIESIRDDDQVALYGFNNKVRLFQDFTNNRYITDYIWDVKAQDATSLYDCLDQGIDALAKRPEKRRAVLLISDGWDSSSHKASMDSVMKKSHAAGVTIYTVDLTDDNLLSGTASYAAGLRRGRGEMQEFAGQTGGRYVHSPEGDKLEEAFLNIVDELHNQYTLTYYSSNDKRDGRFRKLMISVSKPDLTARYRKGYFASRN